MCSDNKSSDKQPWLYKQPPTAQASPRVCTRWTLCCLMWVRNSYTLTVLSEAILSSMESSRMKAPVRPTPAVQCTTMADCGLWSSLSRRMKEMRESGKLGHSVIWPVQELEVFHFKLWHAWLLHLRQSEMVQLLECECACECVCG